MGGNSNGSTSTADTLAAVLAGASTAYLDSQNGQPFTATEPVPGTPYGPAGYAQPVSGAGAFAQAPSWLWIGGLVLLGFLILRR